MDRYHSSAIFKGSSIMYKIPITTQHDARQRCPALIVLKEDDDNNNNACCHCMYVKVMATVGLHAQGQYWIEYLSTTNNSNYQYGRC